MKTNKIRDTVQGKVCSTLIAVRGSTQLLVIIGMMMLAVTMAGSAYGQQFCNTSSISIPVSGRASLYPSNIAISGLSGTISSISVTLNGFNHRSPNNADMLLVGPQGQKFIIMSDAGAINGAATPINIT